MHPTNSKLPELMKIKETFLRDGYYRVDLTDTISFLGLNTLMYNSKAHPYLYGDGPEV
jgi:hypothetical protein